MKRVVYSRATTWENIFRHELLRACWSHTSSKRPTAGEIVELLNSNPRLVSPCIDVPLASVQIERADDIDLGTRHGKPSVLTTQKSRIQLIVKDRSPTDDDNNAYSPMKGKERFRFPRNETEESLGVETREISEPLMSDMQWQTESPNGDMPPCVGSYVQAGYIVLDHK